MNRLIKYHHAGSSGQASLQPLPPRRAWERGEGGDAGTVGARSAEWLTARGSLSLAPASSPFPAKTWASFVQGKMYRAILPSGRCFPESTLAVKILDVAITSHEFILFIVHALCAVGQVLFSALYRSPVMLAATLSGRHCDISILDEETEPERERERGSKLPKVPRPPGGRAGARAQASRPGSPFLPTPSLYLSASVAGARRCESGVMRPGCDPDPETSAPRGPPMSASRQ